MSSEIWVWCWLPGDTQPTLAGRFRHDRVPGQARPTYRGEFVYGRSYLGNPDALPLDPIQLRLVDRVYETATLEGCFGPLRDAMPDDWGRYVIDRLHGPQADLTGYLLNAAGDHIGNLGFGAARDEPPHTRPLPGIEVLEAARAMLLGLEQGRAVDPALEAIVRPNTALGGARPKITIEYGAKQWIAKFPARDDRGAPIAAIECAMLSLAGECGIRAARAQVHQGDILLVERFDRRRSADGGWLRDGFLSAQAIFHANAQVQAYSFSGSYPRLAREMAKFAEDLVAQREELFRRMVFNCCTSNTDDHERNHGFLAGDTPGMYLLSPAYDLVPRRHATQRREHALAIGRDGFVATRDNVLSDCEAFGLSRAAAARIVEEVEHTVQARWRRVCAAHGLSEQSLDELAGCFEVLPERLPGNPRPPAARFRA